jgi:hypothetical protein
VEPLVESAFRGFNTTLFAYGQTGTGKTHTMLGVDIWGLGLRNPHTPVRDAIRAVASEPALWGVVPRAMQHVFAHVRALQDRFQFKVWCSYLEIYNEQVYDLLEEEEGGGDSSSNNNNYGDCDDHDGRGADGDSPVVARPSRQNQQQQQRSSTAGGALVGGASATALSTARRRRRSLEIREDRRPGGGVFVPDATDVLVQTEEQVRE